MRVLLCAAAFAAFGQVAMAQASRSPAAAAPRFEVASVKPGMSPFDAGRAAAAGGGSVSFPFFGVRTQPGGRLQALANLQGLIVTALMIGFWLFFMRRMGTWRQRGYFDRHMEFMEQQNQLLERIAVALGRRNG